MKETDLIVCKFLFKEFGLTAFQGDEFSYSPITNTVFFAYEALEDSALYFMNHFQSVAPDIECDFFLASLLHEVGHHFTLDNFSPKEISDYYDDVENIRAYMEDKDGDKETADYAYFDLPVEKAATQWAIDYIRNNVEKIADFWSKFLEARVQEEVM